MRTLGDLRLEGVDASGLSSPRKELALLAFLCSRAPRCASRPELADLLWDEREPSKSRKSLRQALLELRRVIGELLIDDGTHVRIDPHLLAWDVGAFESALGSGDLRGAAAFWRGDFLEGCDDLGGEAFRAWLDAERERLRRRLKTALDVIIADARRRGDSAAAAHHAEQLAAALPLDEDGNRHLIEGLLDSGQPGRAATHYSRFVASYRATFECDPPGELLALGERASRAVAESGVTPGVVQSATTVESADVARDAAADAFHARESHRRRARRRMALAAVGTATLIVIAATALTPRPRDRVPVMDRVVIFPFAARGKPPGDDLDVAAATLLAFALDSVDGLRTVEPSTLLRTVEAGHVSVVDASVARATADRLDARLYLLGEAVHAGGKVRMLASLYERDTPAAPIARASAEGDATELFRLVDDLARQLLAARHSGERERVVRLAAKGTTSLPAFKAYVEGERALRSRRHSAAREAFVRATALDTGFGLARYRVALAEFLDFRSDAALIAVNDALRREASLPVRHRLLLRGLASFLRSDADDAERLYRAVLADDRMNVDALYLLGELLQHRNPPRGRSMRESREPFNRLLALDPDDSRAIWHLARVAAIERNLTELDTLLRRVDSNSSDALRARTLRAFTLGSPVNQQRAVDELRSAPARVVFVAVEEIATLARDLTGAERAARVLLEPSRLADDRALGLSLVAYLRAARGEWESALTLDNHELRRSPRLLATLCLLAAQPFAPASPDLLTSLRARIAQGELARAATSDTVMARARSYLEPYLTGLLSARLGDTRSASAAAVRLEQLAERSEAGRIRRSFAREIRALTARQSGSAAAALEAITSDELPWWRDVLPFPFQSGSGAQFWRAEWLRELGRDEEALRWYRTLGEETIESLIYAPQARLREAEIEAKARRE